MSTHVISFRLANDANYAERWESTMNAIRKEAIGGSCWEETTSFVVLQSLKSAEDIARAIYLGSLLNSVTDTLLVINSSNNTFATQGKINYPATLASLFASNANAFTGFGRTILG